MNLNRRRFSFGLCGCTALALLGCATAPPRTDERGFVEPRYRPVPESDEKGLWSLMDRAERELARSRFVVREREVNEYIRAVACRLSDAHCADLRAYVVRTPLFNASMAPNGMMEVWTGLLLRCRDEAQLAAVIGHEMGHYLRRHTLERWRDVRSKSDISAFLGLGLAAAGAGWAATVTELALLASVFAFNREQEREADAIGVELMAQAGYAPLAAAEVWDQLIAELKASTGKPQGNVFFATHPQPQERLEAIRQLAEQRGGDAGERGRDRHRAGLRSIRAMLLEDELSLRQYGRSEIVIEQLLAEAPDDGELWFAKGEVYRLRWDEGDAQRALAAYERAVNAGGAPPEVHRSLGLVALKTGDRAQAKRAFETYLRVKPDAPDREAIHTLLAQ